MAKKKLNTNFLVVVAAVATAIVGAGGIGGLVWYRSHRPDQLKAEGRDLMLKGDYTDAFKRFSRAGTRKQTDAEFLTWMQETETHLTSFDPLHQRAATGLLDAIIGASSDKVPPTIKKLQAYLNDIEIYGIDQYSTEVGRDLNASAKTVLDRDPKNPYALRIQAFTKLLPLFQAGAVTSSAEAQTIVEEEKSILELLPDDPDIALRYAQALLKHRDALVREMSVSDSPTSEQALATYAELKRLSDHLLEIGNNESIKSGDRVRAHYRGFQLLQVMLQSRLTSNEELQKFTLPRMKEVSAKASELAAPGDELFSAARMGNANFLASPLIHDLAGAEKVLRETVDQLPKQWQPRLALAGVLAEAGKPKEAVEVLSVEKSADYELTGMTGVQFYNDTDVVPLRRAYFRYLSLNQLEPEKREAEIARIETDYKAAVASPRIGESNPYALQIQAALQEVRQDRTGAVQTLTQALTKMSDAPEYYQLRTKILEKSRDLNLTLNQTGRAEEIALQLMKSSPNLVNTLQLIDLQIRNNHLKEAKELLNGAKQAWPDNPALTVLEIKMLPDEASKLKAFDRIPEDNRNQVEVKMKFAADANLDKLVDAIALRFLEKNKDDYRVTIMYVQSLLKQQKKDEALQRISALRAKDPADPNLIKAEAVVRASDNPAELEKLMTDQMVSAAPYNKLLLDAQQLLAKNDVEGFLAKMREAEKLDTSGVGVVTERIYYYFMAQGKLDEAEAELNKLEKLKRDPAEIKTNRMRIQLARAAILGSQGKGDEANKLFDQTTSDANALVAEMPNFSGAWIVKGLALNTRGQLGEAYSAFLSALNAQPNNPEALHWAVELAAQLNRGDDMKRLINQGKANVPGDPFFNEAMLRYNVAFGDPKDSIEERIKQRDGQPDNPNIWFTLGDTYVKAAKKETDSAAQADLRKKAIETFTQAKEKFKTEPGFGLFAASVMVDAGDPEGAQKLVESLTADESAMASPAFLAALSNYYIEQKQPERAIDVMQKLMETKKANENQLRGQMAQVYAEMGKIDEALAMANQLQDTTESRQLRVNLLLSAKRIDDANKLANSFLEKDKNINTLLLAAHTEGVANNVARSVDLANQAVAMDANNPAAHLVRAKLLMREPVLRNGDILEDLDAVKKLSPGNIEARVLMSDRLSAMGRPDDAVAELESVVRDVPENREVKIRLIQAYLAQPSPSYSRIEAIFAQLRKDGKMDTQFLQLAVTVQMKKGDIDAAVKLAREAAVAAPNDVGVYRQLVEVMIKKEAYRDVLTDIDRIQKSNKNVYWTYMMKGLVLHRLKNEAEAAKEWDQALNMVMSLRDEMPTGEVVERYNKEYGAERTGKWLSSKMGQNLKMHALMLGLYAGDRKYANVIEESKIVLPAMKQELSLQAQVMILNQVGNAYLLNTPADPAKAREMFEKLAEIVPDDVMTLNNVAYAKLLEGTDNAGAAVIAEKAYALSRKSGTPNASVADTYGWALIQSGKVQEGIDALREAQAIQQLPEISYHLGEAYIREKQKDAAAQSLQNALALVQKMGQNADRELEQRIKEAIARADAMEVQ